MSLRIEGVAMAQEETAAGLHERDRLAATPSMARSRLPTEAEGGTSASEGRREEITR